MTTEEIFSKHTKLEEELLRALSSMEMKSDVYEIRKQIEEIQSECTHFSDKLNFVRVNNRCPYCGKKLEESA